MPGRSKYDELHDKYHKILTNKSGTRYERLAALVFKALNDGETVIHDLKLVGEDSDVKHQIDVTVKVIGKPRTRLLIECKDFDLAEKPVGLDIVRSFRSVVEDTKADVGIILTCKGFTKPAQKYAKSKNIKLGILRAVESADLESRIQKIVLRLVIDATILERASLHMSEEDQKIFAEHLAARGVGTSGIWKHDPVYFVKEGAKEQFCEFLSARANQSSLWKQTKSGGLAMASDAWALQIDDLPTIPFDAIVLDIRNEREEEIIERTSNRVAELILSGFGTADIIIFEDQLSRYRIDPDTGEVGEELPNFAA